MSTTNSTAMLTANSTIMSEAIWTTDDFFSSTMNFNETGPIWSTKNTILFTFNIVTGTICLFVLLLTLYKIWSERKDKLRKASKLAVSFTLSCIIIHFLLGVGDPILFYFHEIEYDRYASTASIVYRTWLIFWALARMNIYFVYIYRLHLIFKGSTFNNSKCIYFTISIGCVISLSSMICTIILQENQHLDGASDEVILFAFISELVFLVMDVIIIIALLILFMTPFMKLVRLANEKDDAELEMTDVDTPVSPTETSRTSYSKRSFSLRDVPMEQMSTIKQLKLLQTTTKIALLVIVSLFSSFMYQFLFVISIGAYQQNNEGLYNFAYTWGVDNCTNIICLYFSYNFAQRDYERVCMDCIKLHSCFLFCISRVN